MKNSGIYTLKIDPEFALLIQAIPETKYEEFEQELFDNGCHKPILVWNNTIVDGHKRYEICRKWEIPFKTKARNFNSREDIIVWICRSQLKRSDLSTEYRRYLIGKLYAAEVIIGIRTPSENESEGEKNGRLTRQGEPMNKYKTAFKLGEEFSMSHVTVYKYGQYASALDAILEKERDLVERILSGNLKISHNNLVELSRLSKEHLTMLSGYLNGEQLTRVTYSQMRHELQWKKISGATENPNPHRPKPDPIPPIRSMPKHDPDAEISSLSLTLPSWISSIERTASVADFKSATSEAKKRLLFQLANLKKSIEIIQSAIEEVE